jgi:hypothetical protein
MRKKIAKTAKTIIAPKQIITFDNQLFGSILV